MYLDPKTFMATGQGHITIPLVDSGQGIPGESMTNEAEKTWRL